METISVIGEGAFGTAVSTLLANNGYTVKLWCYHKDVAQTIEKTRINKKYLPGIILDKKIQPVTDFYEAICDSIWVFEAIPVQFLRSVLQKSKPCFSPEQIWVILSKGIEQETLFLPSQIIDDVFDFPTHKAVFAGPSFAKELAEKQITAVTVAAPDCQIGYKLQELLSNDYFRPYISLDLIGTQVGGALKNVITLAIGMLEGAGYQDNVKAFVLTRGLHEMILLSQACGGKAETIYGLCGVGDLVATAMGKLSRNLEVGKQLGVGKKLETILQETGYIPEGVNTARSIYQLAQSYNLDLPISQGIYNIIYGSYTIESLLDELMARPLEGECEI